MTPAEAAVLLGIAASFDNRKPDADAATAWAMVLEGLRFEDCRDAIVSHYRTSREWIMPADVVAAVKRVRGGRLEDVAPSPPPGMDPDDTAGYQRWLAATRQAIADGREPETYDYRPTRHIGELRGVVKALPPAPVRPRERTAEHDEAMAKVKADLATRRPVPIPHPDDGQALPAPPTKEPEASE